MSVLTSALWSGARLAADAVWPPLCPITQTRVAVQGDLSAEAWRSLTFLSAPWCDICGRPFETATPEGALCGGCQASRPAFDHARAALAYDDASRLLVLGFKRGGRQDLAPRFAHWMARAGGPWLDDADVIAPTPLHYRRLVARRFNQAAELARALARRLACRYEPEALVRVRATRSQGGLSAYQRRRNVSGAFRVNERSRHRLETSKIVLIDDVVTTGATAEACARALKEAGAARVDVLALARRL